MLGLHAQFYPDSLIKFWNVCLVNFCVTLFVVYIIGISVWLRYNETFSQKYFKWLKVLWNMSLLIFFCLFFYKCFFFMGSSHNLVLYGRTGSGESPIGDVMVLLSIIIVFISSLYLGEGDNRRNGYAYLYFFFFVIVTIALVCSRSLLQLLLCFEVLFLPSLYFVHKYGYSSQVESSILFLFGWTVVGSAICLCTVIYLYGLTGSLEFDFIVKYKFTNSEKAVIGVLFFIGFGIKLPLLPFYFWLTKVHVEAPAGFSMFLSGFLVKTAFFCIYTTSTLFKTDILFNVSLAFILLGCLDSSVRMWAADDIKKLVAYTTVQEMNVLLLVFLLSFEYQFEVLNSFLLFHGILSVFLFYVVELIQKQTSTRSIFKLGGLGEYLPSMAPFLWLAILCFRGFPIFIKFLFESSFLCVALSWLGIWGYFIVFLLTVISTMAFCRIWFCVLYGQAKDNFFVYRKCSFWDYLIGFVLIVLIFLLTYFLMSY